MRTLILLALFTTAAMAAKTTASSECPEANQPVTGKDKSIVALGCVQVNGYTGNPNSLIIPGGVPTQEQDLVLERSFVSALQGNMDRETVEYRNGERD